MTSAHATPTASGRTSGRRVCCRSQPLAFATATPSHRVPQRTPPTTRLYSGHPQQLKMPPAPTLPEGPWVMIAGATNTAWAGPWGVSFTANLTPDIETGLGRWSEADFIRTIRTGRHMGRGREVLPPMPIALYNHFTDRDLKAVYAYLRTIPPIRNKVPDPVPPAPQAAR